MLMKKNIISIIEKLDPNLLPEELDYVCDLYIKKINNRLYDFSKYKVKKLKQGDKERDIRYYRTFSTEDIYCRYISKILHETFRIKNPSRNEIMTLLFSTIPTIKDLNDFIIVRADFRSFFESVIPKHVYNKYILMSSLKREEKDTLEKFINTHDFCYSGLSLSNTLTEIICMDFDRKLCAKLSRFGIVFYQRYVDDMLIILNNHITEIDVKKIINLTIKEIFGECPVELSDDQKKFNYISRRDLNQNVDFNYLGYNFTISFSTTNSTISFKYGITEKKIKNYKERLKKIFIEYKRNNNIELLRQRIKMYSMRVVMPYEKGAQNYRWINKGLIANYNELRFHLNDLDDITKTFLNECYYDIMDELGINYPYFLVKTSKKHSAYNLYSNLERNRCIIFEPHIGLRRENLINQIKKLFPQYIYYNKTYQQIVYDYFDLIRIKAELGLRVYDVKFGECIFISYSSKKEGISTLLDCGSIWNMDKMLPIIVKDINKVSYDNSIDLVISHFHNDHVKGIVNMYKRNLTELIGVNNVYIPDIFEEGLIGLLLKEEIINQCFLPNSDGASLFDIIDYLSSGIVKVNCLSRGKYFKDNWQVLWPPKRYTNKEYDTGIREYESIINDIFINIQERAGLDIEKDIYDSSKIISKIIKSKGTKLIIGDNELIKQYEIIKNNYLTYKNEFINICITNKLHMKNDIPQKYNSKSIGNEMSLVFQFTYNEKNYLFTGDIDQRSMKFIENNSDNKISIFNDFYIMKIPHHGTDAHYFDFTNYKPKHIIISNSFRSKPKRKIDIDSWCITEKYSSLLEFDDKTKVHCTNSVNCKAYESNDKKCTCCNNQVLCNDCSIKKDNIMMKIK